jgi:hypothetical protein
MARCYHGTAISPATVRRGAEGDDVDVTLTET